MKFGITSASRVMYAQHLYIIRMSRYIKEMPRKRACRIVCDIQYVDEAFSPLQRLKILPSSIKIFKATRELIILVRYYTVFMENKLLFIK